MQDCYALIHTLLESEFLEVDQFVQKNSWVSEIHKFVSTWNKKVLESWKGTPASKIEVNI